MDFGSIMLEHLSGGASVKKERGKEERKRRREKRSRKRRKRKKEEWKKGGEKYIPYFLHYKPRRLFSYSHQRPGVYWRWALFPNSLHSVYKVASIKPFTILLLQELWTD